MPAQLAEALIQGVPMHDLTYYVPSASVAFIAIAGFDALLDRLGPEELLQVCWPSYHRHSVLNFRYTTHCIGLC